MHNVKTPGLQLHDANAPQKIKPEDQPFAVQGLTVAYHHKPVLWGVSYSAPKGCLTAIIGPNGAGKSTFLKAALGLIPKLSGDTTVFGTPIKKALKRIAYVPQRSAVDWDFPATAIDVVLMGLYGQIGWFRWPSRKHREKALECLKSVGMEDFAKRQIGQLSGGQQQRVFLARALAQDAEMYLMDEPFAGVDAATEKAIVMVLRKLVEDGKTVLVVHHDLETVRDYFSHILLLNGQHIADGPVETTFTSENLQKAYGGRLASTQLAGLSQASGA
ncbi:metal ABC transporter ATP-binding protein [Pseudovibrio sp. Tun.PSC04-5.I4]|uniref:metal ABC transporter ATP-binding protein n=1 Tax=Pseudovibrio sp. Tun.PSC04-5.I4 TaxID=1798213 RepID=UPI000890B553|nr:metal ABC transporter ATP-binding protein [Pseudovibrio sp. Tun.PSC04-5.I4]SDQ82706.1 manganese/zinc/iron transport system ATP- binding protein [Pseudovibrio sp. Tun.PSC04-5.I4]